MNGERIAGGMRRGLRAIGAVFVCLAGSLAMGQVAGKPAVATGQVGGSVIDGDGSVMGEADVALVPGVGSAQMTKTDADGKYGFATTAAGKFKVTASAPGMVSASYSGVLQAGELFQVPALKLTVGSVSSDVSVTASQQELAAAEVKVEEQQRLAGFLPNFFVTYDWRAAPLTAKQKYGLAWKNVIDPANFIVSGAVAGVEQAKNTFPGYGQGAAGYGKRFGAASGDLLAGTMLGGAIFPSLFHQDPRYFYMGTGTKKARAWYAMTRAVVCRDDRGRSKFAYASILGDLSAGAISNLYYPAANRHGAGLTIAEGFLNVGGDAVNDLVQEFVLRHLTPHAQTYRSTVQP